MGGDDEMRVCKENSQNINRGQFSRADGLAKCRMHCIQGYRRRGKQTSRAHASFVRSFGRSMRQASAPWPPQSVCGAAALSAAGLWRTEKCSRFQERPSMPANSLW